MSENPISISSINDFLFCPISIYFHSLYSDTEREIYYSTDQTNGSNAHRSVDNGSYPVGGTIKSLDVYCEKYDLIGKIDIYNRKTKTLTERKKKLKLLYDGYVFQLYAQYFAMKEMNYPVKRLVIHSMDDNKNYQVDLPEKNPEMLEKFEKTISDMRSFDMDGFVCDNANKCKRCIYAPYCDRGGFDGIG